MHSSLEDALFDDKVLAIQTTSCSPLKTSLENSNPSSIYKNFNLGLHVGDCPKQVENNRACLQSLLPSHTSIQWLEQVHGNVVVEISKVTKQAPIADAMITRERNTALAIMTADCLPILLVSRQGDVIAAIHGGWRPLAANIIAKTIAKMGVEVGEIYAWLGPCIGKEAFEVGAEVKGVFVEQETMLSSAFHKQENGRSLADLHQIAKVQLNHLGVTKINMLSECTFFESKKYYSYRRNSITGRMASVITLL